MRNGAKPERSIAPKRKRTADDGMGSVVAEYRRNKDGTLCGPYYYRYTYTGGQRVKGYLPRDEGEKQRKRLEELRRTTREVQQLLASAGRQDGRTTAAGSTRRSGWICPASSATDGLGREPNVHAQHPPSRRMVVVDRALGAVPEPARLAACVPARPGRGRSRSRSRSAAGVRGVAGQLARPATAA